MARPDEKKSSGDEGSFWTSYSDLLLGLSVIFLVLFFFATVRAGLEQMKHAQETKQTTEYLKGKVPQEVAEKNKQQQELVKKSLDEINEKKEIIEKNSKELTQLIQNLDDHKSVVAEVMKDQLEKSAALEVAHDNGEKLQKQIEELEARKADLNREIQERDQKLSGLTGDVQRLEGTKAALETDLKTASENLKQKDEQISTKEQAISKLEQDVIAHKHTIDQKELDLVNQKLENNTLAKSIEELANTIKAKETDIAQRVSQVSALQQQLDAEKQTSLSTAAQLQTEQTEKNRLTQELNNQLQTLKTKEAELASKDASLTQVEKALTQKDSTISALQGELVGEKSNLAKTTVELDAQKSKNARLAGDLKEKDLAAAEYGKKIDQLGADLAKEKGRSAALKDDLEGKKGQLAATGLERDRLRGEVREKDGQLVAANGSLKAVQGQLGEAKKGMAKLDGENRGLKSELTGTKAELGESKIELAGTKRDLASAQDSLVKSKAQTTDCEKTLASLQHNDDLKSRKLASLDTELKQAQDKIGALAVQRRGIASGIQTGLRDNGIEVDMNPVSGVLTLTMDEAFQFKNASAEITEMAKEKLRKIIPIYAKNLFEKPENAGRIANITIVGHSSPRYHQKPIDPHHADKVAVEYNLNLSKMRAKEIAAFIFGDQIGAYAHKSTMKALTKAYGKGFAEPVKISRKQKPVEACGAYDCGKSRRVEISFFMRGEESVQPRQPASVAPSLPEVPAVPAVPTATAPSSTDYGPQAQ